MPNMTATTMLLAIAILQIVDAVTTYYIIKRGIGHEANAVMAWLFRLIGQIGALALVKPAIVLLLYLLVLPAPHATYVLGPLVALYFWVVFNNINVIRRAGT